MTFPHDLSTNFSIGTLSPKSPAVGDHLRSIWNHIKFGWVVNTLPNFHADVPIYFLGRRYLELKGELRNIHCGSLDGDLDAFLRDFSSRLWFSYRENFDPIPFQPNYECSSLKNIESNDSLPSSTSQFRERLSSGDCDKSSLKKHKGDISRSPDTPTSPFRFKRWHATSEIPSNAENIPLSIRTSDCGWGCMLRSGQMLLAQALVVHFLGRCWVNTSLKRSSSTNNQKSWFHRAIIRWFGDSLAPSSPFSIHHLVQASGNQPGSWFGPASMCRTLVIVMAVAGQNNPFLDEFEIYLARDRLICSEEVLNLFDNYDIVASSLSKNDEYCLTDHTGNYRISKTLPPVLTETMEASLNNGLNMHNSEPRSSLSREVCNRGLLILVPMRLGAGSHINSVYISTFLRLLRDPACVGAVGGRPRHSIYITGSQGNRLIYLDPHFCQPFVNVDKAFFNFRSWHNETPKLMNVKQLDPSCAFGFYCGSRAEVVQLLSRLPRASEMNMSTPSHFNQRLIEVVSADEASRLFSPAVSFRPRFVNAPSQSRETCQDFSNEH